MNYTPMPPAKPGKPGETPVTIVVTPIDFSRIVLCAWAWVPSELADNPIFLQGLVRKTVSEARALRPGIVPDDTHAGSLAGHEQPSDELLAAMKAEYGKPGVPLVHEFVFGRPRPRHRSEPGVN